MFVIFFCIKNAVNEISIKFYTIMWNIYFLFYKTIVLTCLFMQNLYCSLTFTLMNNTNFIEEADINVHRHPTLSGMIS